MNTTMLDWKKAMQDAHENRGLYTAHLMEFIGTEQDAPSKIRALLRNGNAEEAHAAVHSLREKARNLGAGALAAAALELEMTVKAGADAEHALCRFADTHMDTLLAMQAFMA